MKGKILYCSAQKANSRDFNANWDRTFRPKPKKKNVNDPVPPEYEDAWKKRVGYADAWEEKLKTENGEW